MERASSANGCGLCLELEQAAVLERIEAREPIRRRRGLVEQRDPDLLPFDEDAFGSGGNDDRFLHRSAAVRRGIVLVEVGSHSAQVVSEPGSRGVEVEVAQLPVTSVPEAVHDERRREGERAGRQEALLTLRAQQKGQLACEDVEEVAVGAVDVEVGAAPARTEPCPRRVQLVLVAKDLDASIQGVADNLAPAGC